ncbi:MAG TPA: deoxyribose-phosphate aldolase [Gemmatimonadaceae bacterium]|nr:deoxyribose-phosphate aldolase [Gemmatimonadaceae bacterium]
MSGVPIDLESLAMRVARALERADQPAGPAPGVRRDRDGARIADFIDHTLLRAESTRADIERLCAEAIEYEFAAVCVNPVWVPLCAATLGGGRVAIATVVGFPLGANHPDTKAAEAALAVRHGATEVDMVAAIGHIKSGDWHHVADDITAVVRAVGGTLVKVIIESAHLTPLEIIKASALAGEAGARYVKTSTGFHPSGGASADAVALMRLVVGDAMGVKASGGIRDCATALRMIASGATRIGTSSGVSMARCLGAGPVALRELLASPAAHDARCVGNSGSSDREVRGGVLTADDTLGASPWPPPGWTE